MRLATCIALEIAVATGGVAAVWFGVGHATAIAGDYFESREASAASEPMHRPTPHAPMPMPSAHVPVLQVAVATVFGAPDAELLAPIGTTPVTHAKLNRGGSSLSLRIDFASGGRAAFKPQQIHPQSDPRREIAAYRIDRLLGIGHVAPAKSAALSIDQIVAGTEPAMRAYTAGRLEEEGLGKDGVIRGVVSWWIPEIKDAVFGGERLDEPEGAVQWHADLQANAKMPAELVPLLAQIATCVLFDVVIDNADRWSGSNTKGSPDGKILYFMDNTLSFSQYTLGHDTNLSPLHRVEVFPRALVGRLRTLTYETVARALDGDDEGGLGPLLTPIEIRAVLARRDHAVQYIDALIAKFGEDAILALP